MELFQALGLNVKVLIAQFVNFAILLFILWKFAYQPMMKFLDDRKEKIENGIKNFEEAEARIKEIDVKEKEVLQRAQKQAQALIEKTNDMIEQRKKDMMVKAKEEINAIVQKTKDDLEIEKKITLKHVKEEAAVLVIAVTEKILGNKVDANINKDLVDQAIKDFSKNK